jgi:hypothetical protein
MISPILFADISDDWEYYTVHRSLLTPLSNESIFMKYHIGIERYIMLVMKSAKKGLENIYYYFGKQKFLPADYFIHTRGYLRREGEMTSLDTLVPGEPWASMEKHHFMKNKYAYLLKILEQLKAQHINVVLYEPPILYTEKYFPEAFMLDYKTALSQLESKQYMIIHKEPFNEMVSFNHFSNIDHMNYKGAIFYTNRLMKILVDTTNFQIKH